jgi:hypothetical protein
MVKPQWPEGERTAPLIDLGLIRIVTTEPSRFKCCHWLF